MGYEHYIENCSICGERYPKRDMNKLFIAYGHTSVSSPKKMCSICDNCLPNLCEYLEVKAPDDTVHGRYSENYYKAHNPKRGKCVKCGQALDWSDTE